MDPEEVQAINDWWDEQPVDSRKQVFGNPNLDDKFDFDHWWGTLSLWDKKNLYLKHRPAG